MINFFKENKFLLIAWLIGCLHIIYQGRRGNPHRGFYDPEYLTIYPLKGVIFTCLLFSAYFAVSLFCKHMQSLGITHWITYIICTVVVLGQAFIAAMGAMHAPPFWGAYFFNVLFLIFIQLIYFPLYFFIQFLRHRKVKSDH